MIGVLWFKRYFSSISNRILDSWLIMHKWSNNNCSLYAPWGLFRLDRGHYHRWRRSMVHELRILFKNVLMFCLFVFRDKRILDSWLIRHKWNNNNCSLCAPWELFRLDQGHYHRWRRSIVHELRFLFTNVLIFCLFVLWDNKILDSSLIMHNCPLYASCSKVTIISGNAE